MVTIEEPLELESDTNRLSGKRVADVKVPMLDSPTEEDTVFFSDGVRRIDFVLAYVDDKKEDGKQESRKEYEDNLINVFKLELEKSDSEDLKTYFLKIHAPWEVLATYAEDLKIKVPFKKNDINEKLKRIEIQESEHENPDTQESEHENPDTQESEHENPDTQESEHENPDKQESEHETQDTLLERLFKLFRLPEYMNPDKDNYLTAPFKKDQINFFVNKGTPITDKKKLFPPSTRNRIVYHILSRCLYYKDDREEKKGIKHLLNNGTYQSAFPLHDVRVSTLSPRALQATGEQSPHGYRMKSGNRKCSESERAKLYEHWAQFRCILKEQPLNLIRKYYGEKIGFYFAWLGLYTTMLFFAAIAGLIFFIYSLVTYDDKIQSKEICDSNIGGSIVMCPLCDKKCGFWKLNSKCTISWQSLLGDNKFTMFFAVFMGIWVTLFLEFWKQSQARLEYEWDLVDIKEEQHQLLLRPEYEAACKGTCRKNPITNKDEPHLSVTSKRAGHCLSGVTVIFWIALMCACITGVIAYRLAVYAAFASIMKDSPTSKLPLVGSHITPQLATSVTASCINFIIIMILSFMYERVAVWITDKEIPKTHLEYESRLTTKMFFFQFVNYYSSCFYIAFFKGKFVGHPGDYNYMFGKLRNEECDHSGCLIELSTQLAVVMIGKQAWGTIQQMLVPLMRNWWSSRKGGNRSNNNSSWEQDHALQDFSQLGLFYEYLDMVIQFGFITLFVASFPLAPLLALINNILEVRVDAWKLTTQYRRPVAFKARSIGAWLGILNGIAVLSVITNACIVSFTSDMIPQMVYQYVYQPNKSATMEGYINNSLSVFNISKLRPENQPEDGENPPWFNSSVITTCRYSDYRYPSGHEQEYSHTIQFWHILAARLAFIIIMQVLCLHLLACLGKLHNNKQTTAYPCSTSLHVVFGVKVFVAWMIPEVRSEVMARVKRQRYLVQDCLHKQEKLEESRRGEVGAMR